MKQILESDVLIIGGGIAGLWAYNCLRAEGYVVVLLEKHALGSGQTIHSQGMIHGGLKYALDGRMGASTRAIAHMPNLWKAAFLGQGDVDLRDAKFVTDHQYLWSTNSLSSKLTSFFAGINLASKCTKLRPSDYPEIFQNTAFAGSVHQLDEILINVPSVLTALRDQFPSGIYHVPEISLESGAISHNIDHVAIPTLDGVLQIKAKQYVLAAGEANGQLLQNIGIDSPGMQIRPLRMTYAIPDVAHTLNGHCIGTSGQPRLTISTHHRSDGQLVWYVGGGPAERGVQDSHEVHSANVRAELEQTIPGLDTTNWQFNSFMINRAEPAQSNKTRPDSAFTHQGANHIVAWPTKLTLAPDCAEQIVQHIQALDIFPHHMTYEGFDQYLQKPDIAIPIWETAS